MNAPQRKLLTTVVLGGAALWVAKEMVPSKKERVIWGVNGQLDHLNDTVERRRERAFGYVVPNSRPRSRSDVWTWKGDYLSHEDAYMWWLTRE